MDEETAQIVAARLESLGSFESVEVLVRQGHVAATFDRDGMQGWLQVTDVDDDFLDQSVDEWQAALAD